MFYAQVICHTEYQGKNHIVKINVEEYFNQNDTSKRIYHLKSMKIESASKGFIGKTDHTLSAGTDSMISICDLFDYVNTYVNGTLSLITIN